MSRLTRPAVWAIGFSALWTILAVARSGTTFHFGPLIVAGAIPLMATLEARTMPWGSLAAGALSGLALALITAFALDAGGNMDGPSLLSFGGALTEAMVFTLVGVVAATSFAAVRRATG